MATPRVRKSPKADYTNVKGIKKMMATPKVQKSPKADYTNVKGVKKMMATPKVQKSPKADYTNVKGVKKMMATPKVQNSPIANYIDVRGVKKMMATPKTQRTPLADYTNVTGMKKLLSTPTPFNSPIANYADVSGMQDLLSTPQTNLSPKVSASSIKRKAETFENSSSKRSRVEITTEITGAVRDTLSTSMGSPRGQGGRGRIGSSSRSPSKTSRGSSDTKDIEIPKFNLEDPVSSTVQDLPAPEEAKSARGRGRAAGNIINEETIEIVAPRRGSGNVDAKLKKGRTFTATIETPQSTPIEEPLANDGSPALKMKTASLKRGQQSKILPKPEVESEEATAASPVKGRRGIGAKTTQQTAPELTPVKGRRGRAAKAEVTLEAAAEPSPVKGRRGRAAKAEVTVEAAPESTPVKARKGRAAKAEVTVETAPEPIPVKARKGRAAKADVTIEGCSIFLHFCSKQYIK